MSQRTLMLIEATGIQDYIFGSNQLAQNIGASQRTQQITQDWVYTALPGPHNVREDPADPDGWRVEDSAAGQTLAAEVVYAGGGNAMLLFDDECQAEVFARRLTARVIREAPGLRLVLGRRTFDFAGQALAALHQDLRGELALRKLDRPASVPLLGLGVTAACKFTGAPAVAEREGRLISAEVQAKLAAEEEGRQRLGRHLRDVADAGFDFISDFGDLGRKGEASYLAVVHTDGNSMGRRIQQLAAQYSAPAANVNYVAGLRRFSRSVADAAHRALVKTAGLLIAPDNLADEEDTAEGRHKRQVLAGKVPVPISKKGQDLLPFRPIVFGGDDVTFVCEGRLGLALAATYLAAFSGQKLSDGDNAYARAGVAVVKSHYPFARAYELAEELCKSAKQYIKACQGRANREIGVTALDWHFAVAGLVLPLDEVRRREYTTLLEHTAAERKAPPSLLMRPVHLGHLREEWRSWQTFTSLADHFQNNDAWTGRRNKVKKLRDALRAGPAAVKLFLADVETTLPDVPERPNMKEQGWQGDECGYFDAVEALDFFVPLKGGAME
jgi:hypothetical protein